MRNKLIAGLTTVVAAAAIAAPAQAQVSPAQPVTPSLGPVTPTPTVTPTPAPVSPANPTGPNFPTVQVNTCKVAKSRNGYYYADCSITANNVPVGQSVAVGYQTGILHTFKPRTKASWSNGIGSLTFTNNGDMPGQNPGTTSDITSGVKLAFRNKSLATIKRDFRITLTGIDGTVVSVPTGTLS